MRVGRAPRHLSTRERTFLLSNPTSLQKTRGALVSLAVEAYRFSQTVEGGARRMDAAEQGRFASQARYFMRKVEHSLAEAGLRLVVVDGEPYTVGEAVTVLNLEDFADTDNLMIDQTLEPTVMWRKKIVHLGVVLVRKGES